MADDNLPERNHTRVYETQTDKAERLKQMRDTFEALMVGEPEAMIIIVETGNKLGMGAMGKPTDLIPLYHAGGGLLAAQLRQVLDPLRENG